MAFGYWFGLVWFGGYNLLKNAIYLNQKVKSFKH